MNALIFCSVMLLCFFSLMYVLFKLKKQEKEAALEKQERIALEKERHETIMKENREKENRRRLKEEENLELFYSRPNKTSTSSNNVATNIALASAVISSMDDDSQSHLRSKSSHSHNDDSSSYDSYSSSSSDYSSGSSDGFDF